MNNLHLFTSAALNYIPKVRILFNSLKKYHPSWKLHLAMADELPTDVDLSNEPFDSIWPIECLDIPDWRGWAFCHTIVELSTAIKPFALLKLMTLPGSEKIIYMDPDMVAFSRLDDILEALDESNLLLTPHLTMPETGLEAIMDNEICSLKHGIYNLGFIGVRNNDESSYFARWWADRLYHFCRIDIKNGLFTDQRWIDLVPAFFRDVAIMRSARHNVASWNITNRNLTGDFDTGFFVNGEPLGFYHFTGFDSGSHNIMVMKNASGNDAVNLLLKWYAELTDKLSHDPLARKPWAFSTFSNGEPIQDIQRLIFRERTDLQKAFPNPFDADGFLKWWYVQGRIEYPSVFDPSNAKNDMAEMFSLSPGYTAGNIDSRCSGLKKIFKTATQDRDTFNSFMHRGWHILRQEGLSGIIKRL